jgi:hypothetical protein
VKQYITQLFFEKLPTDLSKLVGIFFIIIGIVFLYNPTNLQIKISAFFFILATFIILLFNINKKNISYSVTGRQLIIIFFSWVLFAFIFTYNVDAVIFVIFALLGVLVLQEILKDYMETLLKKRMTVIYYFFAIIFLAIVIDKILNVINM